MGTTDVGLIRYLNATGHAFSTIKFGPGETDAEGKFILDLKEEVLSKGIGVVVENYPTLGAFFANIQKHEPNVVIAVFEILHHGLEVLKESIARANGNLGDLEADTLKKWSAPLAVIFYLLFKCYNTFSTLVLVVPETEDQTGRPVKGGKKSRKPKSQPTNYPYWYDWESKLFDILSQIIHQPFKTLLWSNADSNFMNPILQSCSVIMRRNPTEVLYEDTYLKMIVKVLQNLFTVHNMRQEILGVLMQTIGKSDESCKLVACIAKELSESRQIPFISLYILDRCYKSFVSNRPGITEKSLAGFIVEIAELSPQLATDSLPVMVNMLHGDSTLLRGAVILSVGSILKSTITTTERPQTKTLRGHLMKIILNHTNDLNINVRAKAIAAFTKLVDEKSLTLDEIIQALTVISKKVADKASSVRKSAIQFFKTIGIANPIVTKFSLSSIQMKLKTHLEKYFETMVEGVDCLESVLKFVAKRFVDEIHLNNYGFDKLEIPEEMNTPEKALTYIGKLLKDKLYWRACEAAYIAMDRYSATEIEQGQGRKESPAQYFVLFKTHFPEIQGRNDIELELGTIGESERAKHAEGRVIYYKGMKKLKTAFEASFPTFCRILEIGTPTDRKDAINLFAGYCEDGFIPPRELAGSIMTALGKVDEKLASDLIDAFFRIFIPGTTQSSKEIANRLVNLVSSMSIENKEKLITLFQQMFKDTNAMKNCVNELWVIFKENDVERSKAAVYLLGVKGSLNDKLFLEWVEPMMNVGLGRRGLRDFSFAAACCNAMLIMYEHSTSKEPDGLFEHHLLFERLERFIEFGLDDVNVNITDEEFCDFVDVAIRLIYYACNNPMVIMSEIVSYLGLYIFPENFKENPTITESKIKRYASLAAIMIECHIYFYEVIVMEEIKQRKASIEQQKHLKSMPPPRGRPRGGGSKSVRMGRNKSLLAQSQSRQHTTDESANSSSTGHDESVVRRMSRRHMSIHEATEKLSEMEEMIGAGDVEFDRVRDYLDALLHDGFMSQIRIHVLTFCKQLEKLSHATQVACIELMTKVMCINSQSMLSSMQYFVDLWGRTTCPYLKIELIKAAVYINMRFPNSMEDSNKLIITGLRSDNIQIRVATLDFVIYLCLSEVIKAREYVVESSRCLNDPYLPIRDATQDFFMKIGEKTNLVYNCLPEIITFLTREQDISMPEYQQMMKFLLTKLKKPTKLEGFIEKLMARFRDLPVGRPCQDLAYCLSLLSYNDKTFRIIEDRFNSICDKLDDDVVYNSFVQICNNAKKNCTKEYKITVEAFEANLNDWKEKCDRREGKVPPEPPVQQGRNKRKNRRSRRGQGSGSDGDGDGEESDSTQSSQGSHMSVDLDANEGQVDNGHENDESSQMSVDADAKEGEVATGIEDDENNQMSVDENEDQDNNGNVDDENGDDSSQGSSSNRNNVELNESDNENETSEEPTTEESD